MSVNALSQRMAWSVNPPANFTPPNAGNLAQSLARYIPGDIIALYVPIAAGIETSNFAVEPRFWAAVAVSIGAAAWVWGAATSTLRKPPKSLPAREAAWLALKEGWWYLFAAIVATFAWATAVPESWLLRDLKEGDFWFSAAIVGVTTIALVILGSFLAPLEE